jgi:putative colanic acid biosynthesis acetyltransferase WcaF
VDVTQRSLDRFVNKPPSPEYASKDLSNSTLHLTYKRDVSSPHSFANRLVRSLWNVCFLLFYRPSPRVAHLYRVFLLRMFGADLDWTAHPYPSCRIWLPKNLRMGPHSSLGDNVDCYNVAPITIGGYATVSQYSYLCSATHDIRDSQFSLTSQPIQIEANAWVAARTYVGPGVTIAEGAVVGANACVYKDVPAWTVVGGNPARVLSRRDIRP